MRRCRPFSLLVIKSKNSLNIFPHRCPHLHHHSQQLAAFHLGRLGLRPKLVTALYHSEEIGGDIKRKEKKKLSLRGQIVTVMVRKSQNEWLRSCTLCPMRCYGQLKPSPAVKETVRTIDWGGRHSILSKGNRECCLDWLPAITPDENVPILFLGWISPIGFVQ